MLGPDALADVEKDANAVYQLAKAEPEEPPSIAALCRRLTGRMPRTAPMRAESWLGPVKDGLCVFVRRGIPPARAGWLVGHELAEWWYQRIGYAEEDIEERCDALGACLVAPRAAFRLAVQDRGHSVHQLALDFRTTQALAMLRIGEVTGRPVALVRPSPIVRGGAFVWPDGPGLARAVKRPPPGVRPVKVDDRWGLMVEAS